MNKKIIVGTSAMLSAVESLYRQGLVTKEQLDECRRRNTTLPSGVRNNMVVLAM